jgi:hypothetical protein
LFVALFRFLFIPIVASRMRGRARASRIAIRVVAQRPRMPTSRVSGLDISRDACPCGLHAARPRLVPHGARTGLRCGARAVCRVADTVPTPSASPSGPAVGSWPQVRNQLPTNRTERKAAAPSMRAAPPAKLIVDTVGVIRDPLVHWQPPLTTYWTCPSWRDEGRVAVA